MTADSEGAFRSQREGPLGLRTLVAYAPTDAEKHEMSGLLRPWTSDVTTSREAFASALPLAYVGVIWLEEGDERNAEWLARTLARSLVPMVLVARLTPAFLRHLRAMPKPPTRIVWRQEMANDLPRAVESVLEADSLRWVADQIARGFAPSPLMERALCVILLSDVPPATTKALADHLCVAPSTLRYHWNAVLPVGATLKPMLDWALLLRAITMREETSWPGVARRLGIHHRTLERLSHRLAGISLGVLYREQGTARRLFRRWVAEELLPESAGAQQGLGDIAGSSL